MSLVKWGIVGPGHIAEKLAVDLGAVKSARLHAVASRDAGRASDFAERFGAARAYGSYGELAADPEVDAVYVATPHNVHLDAARPSLEAGQAVLCEKPLAATAAQAEELVELARGSGAFLMEAMWTRFLPIMKSVRRWIDEGAIGRVRLVRASFGFADRPLRRRLADPALAGGSVLDLGIYGLAFARWVYGRPAEETRAVADLGASGVDELCSIVQRFPGGGLAEITSAVTVDTERCAMVYGDDGHVEVPTFHSATEATLVRGGERLHKRRDFDSGGFEYQLRAVGRCLAADLLESPQMPWHESLELARTMDEIRRQVGVRYPFE